MPSKVAQAVGTAQQYMPNQKVVYEKRLLGVQQNWNVTAERDDSMARVGQALEALGVSIGNNDLEKEKRDYEVAQAVAPQFFHKLSDEQKRKLTNAEILANTGEYKLIDNRYAIGVLDQLRGEHLNTRWNQEYQIWSQNQPLAGTLEEENQRYHDYMKDKFDEWQQENPSTINNQYAFYNGYLKNQPQDVVNVAQSYLDNKEAQYQQDRYTSLLSKADDLFRGLQYRKDITNEELQPLLMELMQEVNITQGKNPETEFKLVKSIMEKAIEHTGDQRIVDYLGEFTDYRGRPIKETLNPKAYADMTTAQSQRMQNQQALSDQKDVESQTTSVGLRQWYDKLINSDNPADKEKARRVAHMIDPRVKYLENKEEQERKRKAKEAKLMGNQEVRLNASNLILDRYLREEVNGVPQTEKDLEKMGLTINDLAMAMQSRIDQLVESGDDANIAKIARHPLFSKGMQEYFKQHLSIDLVRGVRTPATDQALKLAGSDGSYIEQAVGKEFSSDISALKTLSDVFGAAEGMIRYSETRKRLANTEERTALSNELRYTNVPDFTVYDVYYDAGTNYSFNRDSMPIDMVEKVDQLSLIFRASGSSNEQARAQAMEAVKQQYVAVHGIFIPATDYKQIVNDMNGNTNVALEEAISYHTGGYVYPSKWYSDGSQIYLSVDEQGTMKRIPLSKILNDVTWYAQNANNDNTTEDSSDSISDSERYIIENPMGYLGG